MKKFKKITAVLLSVVMLFSMASTSASAVYAAYLDDSILDQYNSIDKVDLGINQKASLVLDRLDNMLAKEEIVIDLPLIGTVDLTSTDKALDSICSITGNWLFGSLTVGDLVVLEENRNDITTIRRVSEGYTDVDLISSVITYLSHCAPTLVGMIDPSADFSWGMVKGFLPPEFRLITDDFNGWLDELLWEALHPVNSEVQPANLTLDDIVQFMCDNQLGAVEGGARAEAMGFAGVMPGFTLDIDAVDANAYRAVEEGIYQAINTFVLPLINNQLKDVISSAVESNQNSGGDLYQIINVDYNIPAYDFDRSMGVMDQLNDVLGYAVDEMLIPLADRPDGTPYDFVWSYTIPEGETYLDLIEDNLYGVMSMVIVAGGEADFNPYNENYTLKDLGNYIARVAVNQFVRQMDIPNEASVTMAEVAYLGLRELCASTIPEYYTAALPDTATEAQYRDAIIELGADLGAYYLNNNLGLNCPLSTNSGEFLSAFVDWCMPYIDGLFDRTALDALGSGHTGWDEVDAILWEIIPKDWLPYQQMFKNSETGALGTEADLTFESLVDYVLDTIFNFDLNKLNTFFAHNPDSTLSTKNVRKFIIDWVSDILNGAFTPAGKTSCVPANINTFEDLINPVSNGTGIICNILETLAGDAELRDTVLNLVVLILGLSEPQSLGDVHMDIDDRIDCTSGSVDSQLRISNFTDGVNSAWRNENGEIEQDKMYEIELVSLSNNAGLTTTNVAGQKIQANGYVNVAITGSVSANTEARFDLSYYILDEAGNRIGSTPLVKSVYTHLYKTTGNYEVESAESTGGNVTFEAFPTYLYTTDVYNAALFSILATNNSGLITSAVDITKAVVTGTLPAGISANAPEEGAIVSIDDSSLTVDSYGTVNPYVSNVDPDDEQPYGIYEVSIQFEVQGKNAIGQTTTDMSQARDHKIVVYNDFGLEDLLNTIMNENRQRIDYAADADTEWNNYLSAVSAGFALLQGNPDHSKMFDNISGDPDVFQNDYYAKVEAINAAVAALDEKAVTDSAKLAELTAAVAEYEDIDWEDYVLFTYDRFRDSFDRANGIVNSQIAPEGEEDTFEAPAVKLFDLIFAKNQLTLWGGRLIYKEVSTDYLEEAVAKAPTSSAGYAPDLLADVQTELDIAAGYIDGTVAATQGQVNANRVNLLEALRALMPEYLVAANGADTIIDSREMLIYNLTPPVLSIDSYIASSNSDAYSFEFIGSGGFFAGTGSLVNIYAAGKLVATYKVLIYGDLNGDGMINSTDSAEITAYLAGTSSLIQEGNIYFKAADVNFDGVVNEADAALISSGSVSQNPNA